MTDHLTHNHIPDWLKSVMGQREREILKHPSCRFLKEDPDGNCLPAHQQWIESDIGTFWIDSKLKRIIG